MKIVSIGAVWVGCYTPGLIGAVWVGLLHPWLDCTDDIGIQVVPAAYRVAGHCKKYSCERRRSVESQDIYSVESKFLVDDTNWSFIFTQ